MLGEWCFRGVHPPGCTCGAGLCALLGA
jgi:hypothetical protein